MFRPPISQANIHANSVAISGSLTSSVMAAHPASEAVPIIAPVQLTTEPDIPSPLITQGGPKLGAEGFPFRQLSANGHFDKGRFVLDEGVFYSNAIGFGANGWISLAALGYEIINLGGHEVITINDLIGLIEETVGKKAEVQHGPPNLADMRMNWADVTKAGEMLGWEPRVGLQEGVRRLVEWYNAEREWARDIRTGD